MARGVGGLARRAFLFLFSWIFSSVGLMVDGLVVMCACCDWLNWFWVLADLAVLEIEPNCNLQSAENYSISIHGFDSGV